MTGAIFYESKYGSTAQYARWIGEATGLEVFEVADPRADPARFDFVVLASPIYFYKVMSRSWIKRNLAALLARPVILLTVSGAPAGEKLAGWIEDSLPGAFRDHAQHFALRGRIDRREISWIDRMLLNFDARRNPDPEEARQERLGFDLVDKAAIRPVVAAVRGVAKAEAA